MIGAARSSAPSNVANFLGGACLGLLLGMLIGMSASPVVADVIGAITAAAIAFIGLRAASESDTTGLSPVLARTSGFAMGCVLGVLLGLFIRTHSLLSEPLAGRVKSWENAGFPPADARAIVLFQEADILPAQWKLEKSDKPSTHSSLLYGSASSVCAESAPARYENTAAVLKAWTVFGGVWEKVAGVVRNNVPPEKQSTAVAQIHEAICGDQSQ